MNNSNWSGRTARTLEECFGPNARLTVAPDTPPISFSDRVLYWVAVAAIATVAVLADMGAFDAVMK